MKMKRTAPKTSIVGKKADLLEDRHRACKKYAKRTHFFHHILRDDVTQTIRREQNLLLARRQPARRHSRQRPDIKRKSARARLKPMGKSAKIPPPTKMRRGWDSNPGDPYESTCSPGMLLRPTRTPLRSMKYQAFARIRLEPEKPIYTFPP